MVRIDKYLWAVRLFKTRTLASEACKSERVTIGGKPVKPSRIINVNEIFSVKEPPVFREYKILDITENRIGAKLVPNFLLEITSEENIEMLKLTKLAKKLDRPHGAGRPTKKERRDLEVFFQNS